jgi:hyperosmotically inducible periplasmic protein
MNQRLALILCASSLAVACGSSDKPAQSSYEAQTTSARSDDVPASTPTTSTAMPAPTSSTEPTRDISATTYPSTDTSGVRLRPADTAAPAATPSNPPPATSDTAPMPRADNTRVNERDRHDSTLTPMDQGKSADERKITADIRKKVVADKKLSFTAKNVKIITIGTKVTLRGPVKNEQEKAAIEAYAKQIPGVSEVDDQLEIAK